MFGACLISIGAVVIARLEQQYQVGSYPVPSPVFPPMELAMIHPVQVKSSLTPLLGKIIQYYRAYMELTRMTTKNLCGWCLY